MVQDMFVSCLASFSRNTLVTCVALAVMSFTIYKFTLVTAVSEPRGVTDPFDTSIQHPFLLSDNRHYKFYIWRRVFLLHPLVPYLLVPGYIACGWACFLRIGAYRLY